jgi:hypothetical protein
MHRTGRFTAGPLLLLLVLAGCRDGVVSPTESPTLAPPAAAPASIALAPQGRPRLALSGGLPDSTAVDFYVGAGGGVFYTGNHAVVFPAGSVCDPATSTYGPGTWDDACSPLQSTLKVHAEVRRRDGVTSVDFTPALRFVPSTNSSKWVWMVMYSPEAKDATGDLSRFNILYAPTLAATPVDETTSDSTLRTYVDTWSGISIRRIKHFSAYEQGYGVGAGRCDSSSGCE